MLQNVLSLIFESDDRAMQVHATRFTRGKMLRVTVELWPGGRESGRRVITTADLGRVKTVPWRIMKSALRKHCCVRTSCDQSFIFGDGGTCFAQKLRPIIASVRELRARRYVSLLELLKKLDSTDANRGADCTGSTEGKATGNVQP